MSDEPKDSLPIEIITWKDHWSSSTAQSAKEWVKEAKEDFIIVSVGFLLHEDENLVLLSSEHHQSEDSFKNGQGILKPLIVSRERLGRNGV